MADDADDEHECECEECDECVAEKQRLINLILNARASGQVSEGQLIDALGKSTDRPEAVAMLEQYKIEHGLGSGDDSNIAYFDGTWANHIQANFDPNPDPPGNPAYVEGWGGFSLSMDGHDLEDVSKARIIEFIDGLSLELQQLRAWVQSQERS